MKWKDLPKPDLAAIRGAAGKTARKALGALSGFRPFPDHTLRAFLVIVIAAAVILAVPFFFTDRTAREKEASFEKAALSVGGGGTTLSETGFPPVTERDHVKLEKVYYGMVDEQIASFVSVIRIDGGAEGVFSVAVGVEVGAENQPDTLIGMAYIPGTMTVTNGTRSLWEDGGILDMMRGADDDALKTMTFPSAARNVCEGLKNAALTALEASNYLKESGGDV